VRSFLLAYRGSRAGRRTDLLARNVPDRSLRATGAQNVRPSDPSWHLSAAHESAIGAALTGLVGEERLAALEAECARLVAFGAVRVRLLPADGDNESCLVMQDIEGNEFCLD
jgi:hypothetical protein